MKPDHPDVGCTRLHTGARPLLILLLGCAVISCSGGAGDPALYLNYCSACHGTDGDGLRALYPALAGSPYMDQRLEQLPCLMVNGAGTTIVMPGFPQLTVAEITELTTYLNRRWATTRRKVSEEQVAAWLHHCP